MKYAFDSGRWSAAESWRTVRTVRAEPPPKIARQVSRGERRVVFHTAMEQAQQQYAAAAVVGYESRALNLFYGLAQAGKALAASSPLLDQRQASADRKTWKTATHGLTLNPAGSDFWRWRVNASPGVADSFSRASIALDSPTGFKSIELGALAAQVPEFTMEWRSFDSWPRSLHVSDAMTARSDTFYLRDYSGALEPIAVQDYVALYPALGGALAQLNEDGSLIHHETKGPVLLLDSSRIEGEGYRRWPTGARLYAGSRLVFPDPGETGSSLHPLMTWWLLLFGFSILARYHPKEWTEALTMGSSPIASQIEFLLDAAVASVPELLARELWVSPWESDGES
jgi:hypothetical protein